MAHNNDSRDKVMMGAGLAMLAAGAYFFLGPDGKKHQKKMKGWMVKMKGDVLERLEDARDVTEPVYNDIVDTVARTYEVAGKIPKEEIVTLAADLKRHWRTISKNHSKGSRSKARSATRVKSKKTKSSNKK